jgi:putative DNA primase/helicase
MTNHEPRAPAHDFAFWERVFLIPFELSFVDNPKADNERPRDKDLFYKLIEEKSGILASLVRGCLEWQQIGLNPPDEITKATAKYKRSQDNLADFIDECCYIDPDANVGASSLYQQFAEWWEKNISKTAPKQKTFGNWMSRTRFKKQKNGTFKYYGLGLLSESFGR